MSLVSSSRAGTCRADRAFLMAPLIFATNSGLKGLPGAIFKNKITRSSPSALYWGTQRLSDTSSNASTAERRGKERAEWRTRRQNKNEVSRWEARREEEVRGEESKGAKIRRIEKRKRWSVGRVWGNGREQKSVAPLTTSKLSTETLHFCCHYKEESVLLLHSVVWTNNDKLSKLDDGMANYFFHRHKEDHDSIYTHRNAFASSFHPFLHPHPAPPAVFKTHQCCRSLSCQIGLHWGSVYRHCRTNTSSTFIYINICVCNEKPSCHTSYNTLQMKRNKIYQHM